MAPRTKYQELLARCNLLLAENNQLKEENRRLRKKIEESHAEAAVPEIHKDYDDKPRITQQSSTATVLSNITFASDTARKINLYLSLFKGRQDVYASRWENRNKGTSGYAPVCLNQWQKGICGKPRTPCSKCSSQLYAELDEQVVENHLLGKTVIGLYPLLQDDSCWFLAMDFDGEGWRKDVGMIRRVCNDFHKIAKK